MTPEEKNELLKDANVKNILYNSLDTIMSTKVIAFKTTKEIRGTPGTQCQGTKSINKKRSPLLIQEYEKYEVKLMKA